MLAAQPKLLLLDEVLAGLNPTEIEHMIAVIRRICDSGVTILIIEHLMQAIMSLSDRIVVLNYGEKPSKARRPRSRAIRKSSKPISAIPRLLPSSRAKTKEAPRMLDAIAQTPPAGAETAADVLLWSSASKLAMRSAGVVGFLAVKPAAASSPRLLAPTAPARPLRYARSPARSIRPGADG